MSTLQKYPFHYWRNATVILFAPILSVPYLEMPRNFITYVNLAFFVSILDLILRFRLDKKRGIFKTHLEISVLTNLILIPGTILLSAHTAPKAALLFWILMFSDFIHIQNAKSDQTKWSKSGYYLLSTLTVIIISHYDLLPLFTNELTTRQQQVTSIMALILLLTVGYGATKSTLLLLEGHRTKLRLESEAEWMSNYFTLINHHIRSPLSVAALKIEMLKLKRPPASDRVEIPLNSLEEFEGAYKEVISTADQFLSAWKFSEQYNDSKLHSFLQLKAKNYSISFNTKPNSINLSKVEQLTLSLAVDSFVDNAYKYGAKKVELSMLSEKSFSIKDDGLGMSESQLALLGKTQINGSKTGAGLGILLTKKLIQHIGWTLCIESELGRGTMIILEKNREDSP